jgi:hypothetical protein
MSKLQSLKQRFYLLKVWLLLGGTFLVGNFKIETTKAQSKAKDECLRKAIAALSAIKKHPNTGSITAAFALADIDSQLQGVGVVL